MTCCFYILINCKSITTRVLINTSMTSHSYHSLFVVRIFKIHVISNFQVYSTALLSIITMLYIRFLELFHLPTGSFFSLINMAPFYLPITILLFVSISLAILDFILNQKTQIILSYSIKWSDLCIQILC